MKLSNIKLIIASLTLITGLNSCDDWLDVSPKSQIQEQDHFSYEGGYRDQLTGVYTSMSSQSMYGLNMGIGFTEVLSQNYDINSDILNQNLGSIIGTPIFAGGALSEVNYGRIDAWGAEFSLNWRDKIGQVNYNIGVNFGFNSNEVKEWPDVNTNDYLSKNIVTEGYGLYDWS